MYVREKASTLLLIHRFALPVPSRAGAGVTQSGSQELTPRLSGTWQVLRR